MKEWPQYYGSLGFFSRTEETAILVATSIAPGPRIAIQQEATGSWRRHGFSVLSFNDKDEVAVLRPHFPDVTFVTPPRTAKPFVGKPLIFINDLLRYLGDQDSAVVGIMNSDVRLDERLDLIPFLESVAADRLLIGPRLDVSAWTDAAGRVDPWGFDLFFFPRHMIRAWTETRFVLGQGFWDHWLPVMALLGGYKVCKLLPPIARHIIHPVSRDDSFFLFADEFATLLTPRMTETPGGPIADQDRDWQRFGHGFPKHDYVRLRDRVTANAPLSAEERSQTFEALATHIDDLTRYVMRFIERNSAKLETPISKRR